MHIFRIFGVNFGKPERLVFKEGDVKPATLEEKQEFEEAKKKHTETGKLLQEERAKSEAYVQQLELKEKLGEGPAEKYIETFRKFSRTNGFEALTATLEAATELRAGDVPFNFEDWQTLEDQQSIAAFIEEGIAIGTFPGGEGSKEFLAGLKLYPQGATLEEFKKWEEGNKADFEKWKESNRVLGEMAKILKEHFDVKKHTKADTSEQAEKKPFGMKTISDGVKTLMKNFKRGDAMEKTAILGAIGIGIYLLYKYKDSQLIPFWKEATVSKTLLWIGAGLGLNYLSGKVSPDGKTLLQRFDLFKDIDELHDENVMKAFAINNKMDEDQEKLSTFYKVLGFDVRRLYELYRDSKLNSVSTGKKEIDPKHLGFYKGEVDGKALYEIIENLVQFTAVNEQTRRREEDAKNKGIEFVKPSATEIAAWKENADAAFEEKYFNGPLGQHKQTLFDAIINEYRTSNWQEIIAQRNDLTRPRERVKEYAKEKAKWAYKNVKEYGGAAAGYVWEKGGQAANWTYDNILKPIGSFAKEQYKIYDLYGLGTLVLRSKMAVMQERDINKVLPPELAVRVTEKNKAEIMDFPEIPFEIKKRDPDDKEVAIINGIEFLLDDGITGNKANADKLKNFIQAEVEKLIKDKSNQEAKLKGKTPRWDAKEKKWFIDNIEIENDQDAVDIGLPKTEKINLSFTIDKDRRTLKFYENSKEIKDISDIAHEHRDVVIKEKIYEALKAGLKKIDPSILELPITDIELQTVMFSVTNPRIEGKIGGLEFAAELKTPGNINGGVDFIDDAGNKGLSALKINDNSAGKEFLRALSSNILKKSTFATECLVLRAQMENVGEGFFARIGEAFKTTKWWIIPTNPAGAINGKILQNQWFYTLEYKKFEAIGMFEKSLLKKSAAEIENSYQDWIIGTKNQMHALSSKIASFRSPERVAEEFKNLQSELELINYNNDDYKKLFAEFKDMIKKYDYKGLESVSDLGLASTALETHQYLIRVWHDITVKYAAHGKTGKLDKTAQDQIRFATGKIREKLDIAASKGAIEKANLPPYEKPEDLEKKWLQ